MVDKYLSKRTMRPAPDRSLLPESIDDLRSFLQEAMLFHDAQAFPSAKWLIPAKDDDLHAFLLAAILLGNARAFIEVTRLMVM